MKNFILSKTKNKNSKGLAGGYICGYSNSYINFFEMDAVSPKFCCRFPLNSLFRYSDIFHKMDYDVDAGEIIINNVSDINE